MSPSLQSYEDVLEILRPIRHERGPTSLPDPSLRARRSDPEVTVSMPARNAARFVGTAIRSVLDQDRIGVHVVVVDDASSDATRRIAESFRDPRVSVLTNERPRGIGYSHNRVLEITDTPYVVHVDADDFVVPWAVKTMVAALRDHPGAGQAYCNFFMVGPEGRLSRAEYRRQKRHLEAQRAGNIDYRRRLVIDGMVTNTLRTYRTRVLRQLGGFDEDLPYAVDYEMSVRIADVCDIHFVPEFLYFQRRHAGNTQQNLPFRSIRSWWTRARICLRLLWQRGGDLMGYDPLHVGGLLSMGLIRALGVEARLERLLGRA